ncbi:hypothetical protein AB833_30385 [Chromatiales bacterium (ex Bugula neritina AB1)]|nr:hypothetical protein AB833_30385 [Chromatiales bacterium (ex Bugula neritina AB1)]
MSIKRCRSAAVLMSSVIMLACTQMPARHTQQDQKPAVSAKGNLVAQTPLNSPVLFTDNLNGEKSEIIVVSEYISANGRACRRFTEKSIATDKTVRGLSCQESETDWREIPLATFAY